MKRPWRDLVIALSLANLCFLRVWSELLTYGAPDTFLMKSPPPRRQFFGVVLNVLLLTGLLWAAISLARWERVGRIHQALRYGFSIFLLVPLNAIRSVTFNRLFAGFPSLDPAAHPDVISPAAARWLLTGLAFAGAVLLVRANGRIVRAGSGVLLALFPMVPITFSQALWNRDRYDPRDFADRPPAPRQGRSPRRALWIIFDEWDQRLAFSERPQSVQLPNLDRLRDEALYATRAYPPGPGTLASMTSLTTGRVVRKVKKMGAADLRITFANTGETAPWGRQATVFSRARSSGINTAAIGWYLPYCRVLDDLTYCRWWEMGRQYNSTGETLTEILFNQSRSLLETNSRSVFGQSLATIKQRRAYEEMLEQVKECAADPELGLILVHFPVPHEPFFYDRSTGRFSLRNSPVHGYLDGLELVDRTIGEIRRAMEQAGTWENTALLLSSDHSYRRSQALDGRCDRRVPFLLKLPGAKQPLVYEKPVNTVISGDLLLAVLRGEARDLEAAASWLERSGALP